MIRGLENLMHENIEEIGFIHYEMRLLMDMCEPNHCLPTPGKSLLQRWGYFLCKNIWWQDYMHEFLQGKIPFGYKKHNHFCGNDKILQYIAQRNGSISLLEIFKTVLTEP